MWGIGSSELAINTRSLSDAVVNVAYTHAVVLSNCSFCGSYTWSITDGLLPTGVSLAADGLITGTPTEVGTFDFTVGVVSGNGQEVTKALSITVVLLQVVYPQQLCSDYFDAAIATFEDSNLESAVRVALGVDAEADLTCGLISGVTDLDAAGLGIVSLVGIQNLTGPSSLNLSGNTALKDVMPLSVNPVLGTGDVVDLKNTDVLCDDSRIIRVKFRGVFIRSDCPLGTGTESLPAARARLPYSGTLAPWVEGDSSWVLINGTTLPTGLNLAANGDITGTPPMAGKRIFEVKATNSAGQSVTKAFSITVR